MSSAEARQRFTDAVLAMAFAQEQMRLLHNVRITDEEAPVELASALKELSPQRVEDAIHLVLDADPTVLQRESLAALKPGPVTAQLGVALVPLKPSTAEQQRRLGKGER